MSSMLHSALLYYGTRLPYHPGKWRVVAGLESLLRASARVPRPVRVRRAGLEWELDISCLVQRSVYYLGGYEVHESAWLRRTVRPDWICMDVGANFGYFSVLLGGMTAGGGGRVIAFEPSPDLHRKLLRNLELNGFTHVVTEERALSDREGRLRFVIADDDNQGLGHLQQQGEEGGRVIEVRTESLDQYARREGIDRLDFVKVDIEGAECQWFDGARETIAALRPAMLVELNPGALLRAGCSGDALLQRLHAMGYEGYMIRGRNLRRVRDASVIAEYCNLLCLHPESHAGLLAGVQ